MTISVDVDEHRRSAPATRSSSCTSATRRRRSPVPVLELRGFRRVSLEPGECRTVSFTISAEQFAYVGADHRRVVEPGISVHVGTSSVDLPVSTEIRLVGPTVEVGIDTAI